MSTPDICGECLCDLVALQHSRGLRVTVQVDGHYEYDPTVSELVAAVKEGRKVVISDLWELSVAHVTVAGTPMCAQHAYMRLRSTGGGHASGAIRA